MRIKLKTAIGLLTFVMMSAIEAGIPLWTFTPLTATTLIVPKTGTATVQYKVQNQSHKAKRLVLSPAPGVQQIAPCNLNAKGQHIDSCVLGLRLTGRAIPAVGISGGPILCQANPNGTPNLNQCYQPARANQLNVALSNSPPVKYKTVTPSGDGNETITPSTPQQVNSGATQSFNVTANTGYTLSTNVGGTCPAGSWSGETYTTGIIYSSCTVHFSATQIGYNTVTPSGDGNETITPSTPQQVNSGATQSFNVTANTGYTLSINVGGTCPAGSWSGETYTTGNITSNCTVEFKILTPASTVSVGSTLPLSFYSSDLGINWVSSLVPPSPGSDSVLSGVSCAGLHCAAVGYDGSQPITYSSVDGGNIWTTSVQQPGINQGLYAVGCAENNAQVKCSTVGQNLSGALISFYSNDAGVTWVASVTPPQGSGLLYGVSCFTSNGQIRCSAVGGDNEGNATSYVSADGGVNWAISNTPPGKGRLVSISCVSTNLGQSTNCTAVGIDSSNGNPLSYTSANGGVDWSLSITQPPRQSPPNHLNFLQGVSCVVTGENDSISCSAVGFYLTDAPEPGESLQNLMSYFSNDGGVNWAISTTQPLSETGPIISLNSVDCVIYGQIYCAAVGTDNNRAPLSYYSTDGGANWAKSLTQPPGNGPLYSVAIATN